MIKELKQSDFAAPIIEDLGMMRPSPTAKRVMRFVKLECTECRATFKLTVDNAKRRQEHKCPDCKLVPNVRDFKAEFLGLVKGTRVGRFNCANCAEEFEQSIVGGRSNAYGVCNTCRIATDSMIGEDGSFNLDAINKVLTYNKDTGVIYNTIRDRVVTLKDDGRIRLNNGVTFKATRLIFLMELGITLPDNVWFTYKDGNMTNSRLCNLGFTVRKPVNWKAVAVAKGDRAPVTIEKFKDNVLAAKAITREECKNVSGYSSIRRQGLLIQAFDELGIASTKTVWSLGLVKERALQYNTKAEFKRLDPKAYNYSVKYSGAHAEVTSHMIPSSNCDNDAIYIWRVIGEENLYKIGVTSVKLGCHRIEHVARRAGMEYEVVILQAVNGKATDIESLLLSSVDKYEFDRKFDGSTEFRLLSTSELTMMVDIIKSKGVI